jgi:pSer/pThr/pTyr-binding forkhead associated (FHA) protein
VDEDEAATGDSTIVDPKLVGEGWEDKTIDQGRPAGQGPPTVDEVVPPLPAGPILATLPLIGSPGRLVVTEGTDRGREFPLAARHVRVGRGADNGVVLSDLSVSRHHIAVHFDGARYAVEDLGSGNGTVVNGVHIDGKVILRNGDLVELGTTILRFQQSEAKPQPPRIPTDAPIRRSQGSVPLFPLNAAGPSQDEASGRYPFAEVGNRVEAPMLLVPVGTGDVDRGRRRSWMLVGAGAAALALTMGGVGLWRAGRRSGQPVITATETRTVTVPILTPLPAPIVTPLPPPPAVATLAVFVPPGAPAVGFAPEAPAPVAVEPPKPVAVEPPKPVAVTKPPPKPVAATKPPPARKPPPPKVAVRPTPPPIEIATVTAKPRSTAKTITPKLTEVAQPPALKPAAAARTAASLYAARKFDEAAATLSRATEADPSLRAVARDYAAVGAGISRGDAAAAANPMVAMAAYQDALKADQRSGKGQHGKTLRGKLTQVAPRAAVAFLESGRLESARASADMSSPGDPLVKKVRLGLEDEARELFQRGQELSRSQPDAARAQWRRVMKIVSDESVWYEKADAALGLGGGVDL